MVKSKKKNEENKYKRGCRALQKIWRRLVGYAAGIPMERMAVYAGILLVLSLIPLLWLGRYNVMCIDDYDYGRRVHDVWMESGSLVQSVQEAWRQNMEFYRDWQGTYISCFLMALCPMNFKYEIAWVVPLLMVGLLVSSVFLLGTHILRKWLGADAAGSAFVMFTVLFMFYQVLEAPFEGIYWYNGATHYVLMQSVWFFALAAVSSSLWTQKKAKEMFLCLMASILAVIVGGGNLVTGLQAEILLALLVLYAAVINRRKLMAALIPFLIGSAGFLVNVMAPGNIRRGSMDMDEGYSAVASVLLSFYHAVVFIIRWTPVFVVLIWLALLPVLWKMMKHSRREFRHPVWVTAGAFCVLSAMFTPTLYALGMVGLSRIDNIIQMVYYLCLVMVTAYWMGYFAHRRSYRRSEDAETDLEQDLAGDLFGSFLERTRGRMTAVCLLLTLLAWIFTADKNTYTTISALRSLHNGDAQTFYAEAMARHEIYIDERIVDVELKPYSARPALFDFNDLTEDAGNWLNLAVMQYYHKAYVKVVE